MLFDFKELLNLDNIIGKRLVTVYYYLGIIAAAVGTVVMFISGIASVAGGRILSGLGQILFCLPVGVLALVVHRIICELIVTFYEHCGKE